MQWAVPSFWGAALHSIGVVHFLAGVEPGSVCMQGRHSVTELRPCPPWQRSFPGPSFSKQRVAVGETTPFAMQFQSHQLFPVAWKLVSPQIEKRGFHRIIVQLIFPDQEKRESVGGHGTERAPAFEMQMRGLSGQRGLRQKG